MKSDFNDSQFLGKMQKRIQKLPKRFAKFELQMANSNPDFLSKFSLTRLFF